MQHLGIIEQRTNEVLQMYAASGAAFQEAGGGIEQQEESSSADNISSFSGTSGGGGGGGVSTGGQSHRLSLGVGPQQASGSHVVRLFLVNIVDASETNLLHLIKTFFLL